MLGCAGLSGSRMIYQAEDCRTALLKRYPERFFAGLSERSEEQEREAALGLLEDFGTSWNWEPVETVPTEELDDFRWTAWTQAHTQEVGRDQLRLQYAVVRQGNRVLAVEYQGTADLRDQESYLAELLNA